MILNNSRDSLIVIPPITYVLYVSEAHRSRNQAGSMKEGESLRDFRPSIAINRWYVKVLIDLNELGMEAVLDS